ncbi:MAG: polyprenyl diphosphate synthase [bacterium]|nr:polyprenyl diphosphate synthase [bacterium]
MPDHDYKVKHIAIIPDGNRRWAKARGNSPWAGHRAGHKAFEDILKKSVDMNVYCLSFWGMSIDNIRKREKREIAELFNIFRRMMQKALGSDHLKENDVRVRVMGEWREMLPEPLVNLFHKVIGDTRSRTKHVLNLLICYDGKSEMRYAFKEASAAGSADPKEYLYTKDLPPVDLVIRTGGDPHLSAGFMMWDVADAQLHFSDKMWPDFTPEDFEAAVNEFQGRERRLGS